MKKAPKRTKLAKDEQTKSRREAAATPPATSNSPASESRRQSAGLHVGLTPAEPNPSCSRAQQSLGNSELRYRRLFETAQDGILILDAKTGAITDVNLFLIDLLGYSREEFVEKKLWQVGAFKDIEASKDAFEALQRNEYIRYENLPLRAKTGRLIQVEFVSNVYLVGEAQVIQCNIRDITEHKQLVAALRENERKYRSLVMQSPDGMFLVDLSGNFTSVNRAMCDALGIDEADFRSMNIWDIIPEQYLDQYKKRLTKILNGEILNEPSEYTVRGKDGQVIFIEVMSAPYYSDKGIIGFQGIARDITARKRGEEALRESEERFHALVENTSDLIAVLNQDGTLRYASPAITKVLGYTVAEATGKNIYEFVHPEDVQTALQAVSYRLEHPEVPSGIMEVRARHADGSWRVLEGQGDNLLDNQGVKGIVLNFHDITEPKRAEETLRQRLTELEAVHTVSTALRKAQTRDEAIPILLDETLIALETDAGAVWLYHADTDELRAAVTRGWYRQLPVVPMKPGTGIAGTVFASGETHISAEIIRDPLARHPAAGEIPAGWGGVCLPIRTGNMTVGVLFVSVQHPRQITPHQVQVLESLTGMAGTTLHRMSLHEETVRQLDFLKALHSVDIAISASMDLHTTLNFLLEHLKAQLHADATEVLLLNPHSQTLEYAAGSGFRTRGARTAHIRLGENFAGRVALERLAIEANDPAQIRKTPHFAALWASEGFAAYYGMPLIAKGVVKGVLEVYHRAPFHPDPDWIGFLEALAGQAAIAIDNAQLFESQENSNTELILAYDTTIEGWSQALDLRDRETKGHTVRVTEITLRLAKAMGIGDAELAHIRRGALLHDIGKMGVPDSILLKPAKLTDEEWILMRLHPQLAFNLISPINYLRPALDIPYCHHEKWDGTGYPRGLVGEQIPLAARIFAVVDVWDALRSDRPYRAEWADAKVLEYIRSQAGTHFDPQVVKVCMESGVLGT